MKIRKNSKQRTSHPSTNKTNLKMKKKGATNVLIEENVVDFINYCTMHENDVVEFITSFEIDIYSHGLTINKLSPHEIDIYSHDDQICAKEGNSSS